MRSGPSPALHNVLVTRPGSNSTAVVRRDDLLAAAVLAADEREPRRRSVLALMHRRWARFSESLRRRRPNNTSASTNTSAAHAAAALAATEQPFRAIDRNHAVQAFEREREKVVAAQGNPQNQADTPESHPRRRESDVRRRESSGTASVTGRGGGGGGRRVRQYGAREDDDTLLLLPRVGGVSFSGEDPDAQVERVRQLPRVSALRPMRITRRVESPLSSDASDTEEEDEQVRRGRQALHRLPTGMTNTDVERAMERAVVEIASDDDDDDEQVDVVHVESGEVTAGVARHCTTYDPVNRPRQYSCMVVHTTATDVHALAALPSAFTRRVNSAVGETWGKKEHPLPIPGVGGNSWDWFEDDYLSFQGFQGIGLRVANANGRTQFGSKSGLLRVKRMSSVTESEEEGEGEGGRRRGTGWGGRRGVMWGRRNATDVM